MKVRFGLCGLLVAGLLLSAAPAPGAPVLTSRWPAGARISRAGDYSIGLDAGQSIVVWCNSNLDLLVYDRFPGGLLVGCVGLDHRAYLALVAAPEVTATPRPTRTPTPTPPVDTAGPPTHTPTISTAMP